MAYWGMAFAQGPNINNDITPQKEIKAYEFAQKALRLSSRASESEKAYINALATRYTNDPRADFVPLRYKYRDAMKKVIEKYPEDLDAATLYAESILNLDPWKYWTWDGKPTDGVIEATEILNSVLISNPEHIGANHFNIHAWEESPTPERALLSAQRLVNDETNSGHLLHMPCHIFLLTGDYEEAIKTSKRAIRADKQYIYNYGLEGEYPVHYLSHNLYILVRSYMLSEDYDNSIRTALELKELIYPHLESMPGMASNGLVPLEVYLYFNRWRELLQYKFQKNKSPYVEAYLHFSRAIAYANLGNLGLAFREKKMMLQVKSFIQEEELIAINPATKLFEILELVLNATLSGVQNQIDDQIENLKEGIVLEDRLNYSEPPAWYAPIRTQLGKVLLQQGRYSEATEVFREALKKRPRNGRLLLGLTLSLKGQGQTWNAFWAEREMAAALKNTQTQKCLSFDEL
ncbi:MAG: tetratricopeptide repeat protein [Parachlamydiaceae bacterium]|nr:tetratricopeptide repeat protein [Parachlamydiaceae bacterium]